MKVLLVHNVYRSYGGEDTAVSNKIKLLESNNITVKLFSANNIEIDGFLEKFKIFFTSIFSLKTAKKFNKTIKEFEPDIIEVHNIFPLISPSIFFEAQKMKIPLFYYLHNYRFICGSSLLKSKNKCCEKCNGNFFKAIINKCYRNSFLGSLSLAIGNLLHKSVLKTWSNKVDYFIIMNERNIKHYTNYGIDINKIFLLPHFSFMGDKSKKNKEDFALFVGEFSKKKGIHTLIKAFRGINYKLKLIGQVKNKNSEVIKGLKNEQNINLNKIGYIDDKKNIENIGYVDNNEIDKYYSKANFTIFPSEWDEPFGYVLIESFANHTPVIASDQASIKNIVKNNFNGILFKKGNYLDLRSKIEWMIKNSAAVNNLSLNAKKYFNQNFSHQNQFPHINEIYSKAIKNKNSKIVFATTTRNPGKRFIESIEKVTKIGKEFKSYHIVIVESDSEKNKTKIFDKYKNNKNITIIQLGNLANKLEYGHLRTERISHSRNAYINFILNDKELKDFEYLLSFDSDGVNNLLSYQKIKQALNLKIDWTAQFSNQLIYYYDIYALRSKDWVEENYKMERDRYLANGLGPQRALRKSLSEKIININKDREPIPVESAFGGLGIFKINRINKVKYVGQIDGKPICEHIMYNKDLGDKYPNTLFINPKLISGLGFNEHIIGAKILLNFIPSFIFNRIYKHKMKNKFY